MLPIRLRDQYSSRLLAVQLTLHSSAVTQTVPQHVTITETLQQQTGASWLKQ